MFSKTFSVCVNSSIFLSVRDNQTRSKPPVKRTGDGKKRKPPFLFILLHSPLSECLEQASQKVTFALEAVSVGKTDILCQVDLWISFRKNFG